MSVTVKDFSTDKRIKAYTLRNVKGTLSVTVTTYGARINNVIVLDRNGKNRDVCVGFDDQEQTLDALNKNYQYYGATVGRVAGRICPCRNIAVGDKIINLTENQPGQVCLHGGKEGWDAKIWDAEIISQDPPKVKMTLISKDGEEGFCGTIKISNTFEVTDKNELILSYDGQLLEGEASLLNPTNHVYFNLSGFEDPTVRNHIVQLDAYGVLETDDKLIPKGWVNKVDGTPFDFRKPLRIGRYLDIFANSLTRGYDNAFITNKPKNNDGTKCPVKQVAQVWCNISGIKMTVRSNEPCLVFYTSNYFSADVIGKTVHYPAYSALALEAQRYSNAIQIPEWKDMFILNKDQTYEQTTVYSFSTFDGEM